MFYETKVLDAYGNLKKIVSSQELHIRHWKIFQQLEERNFFNPKKISSLPKRNKGKQDAGLLVVHLKKAS
jgi:hypothetical protein